MRNIAQNPANLPRIYISQTVGDFHTGDVFKATAIGWDVSMSSIPSFMILGSLELGTDSAQHKKPGPCFSNVRAR